jgi:hypothetical protein
VSVGVVARGLKSGQAALLKNQLARLFVLTERNLLGLCDIVVEKYPSVILDSPGYDV